MNADEQRPVVFGLLALVAVAVAVGLVTGLGVRRGRPRARAGWRHTPPSRVTVARRWWCRSRRRPSRPTGPRSRSVPSPTSNARQSPPPKIKKPKKPISLQAGETSVAPMGRIDLTGTYPGGEGAVLNVQKFSNGSWQDFYSISASVTNGTFSTYIQTGTPGMNRFRVIDSDTQLASNEVKVTSAETAPGSTAQQVGADLAEVREGAGVRRVAGRRRTQADRAGLAREHPAQHQHDAQRLEPPEGLSGYRDAQRGADHRVDQPDQRDRAGGHRAQPGEPAPVGEAGAGDHQPQVATDGGCVEVRRGTLDEPGRREAAPGRRRRAATRRG